MIVAFSVLRPDMVGVAEEVSELPFLCSVNSSSVGGSLCTSLKVMACCALPWACSLTLRPCGTSSNRDEVCGSSTFRWLREGGSESSSPLSDPEAPKSRSPLVVDATLFGRSVLADVKAWLVMTVAGLRTCGALPRREVWGPWSKARGWRPTVGRRISGGWTRPLGGHSSLLEPSWCQSVGGGAGFWVTAMETGCWDVRLTGSSSADVTSPDSARKARTPTEEEKAEDGHHWMWLNLARPGIIYTISSPKCVCVIKEVLPWCFSVQCPAVEAPRASILATVTTKPTRNANPILEHTSAEESWDSLRFL